MKITMLSPFSSNGATTGRLHELARNMGSTVRILIPRSDKYGRSKDDRLFLFTLESKFFLLLPLHVYRALKYLREQKPQVVYFAKPHLFTFLPAFIYKVTHPDCSLVFDCDEWDPATLRDNEEAFYKVWLTDFLAYLSIMLSDKVVYSNTLIKDEHIPRKYWEKCSYISNGVDTKVFRAREHKKSKEFSLMFVGLLHKIKHILPILDAVEIASKEIPNVKCNIVGDGPRRKELEQIVASKGLGKFFVFAGTVPHETLPELLPTADVLIAPFSDMEGVRYQSNVKIFEYMAVGVPIIATDVGDIKRILGNGEASYVVPPDNSEAIAKKVIYVYQNPGKSKICASLARKLAVEMYDWRVLAKKLETFLG
ncbi:glycosyltransferase family 4 protein [Candidatus Micrarchaeota archaeon]|nr:glycosyltransferase family 4 protein [Candidatus Micrarchaeota archaeon]